MSGFQYIKNMRLKGGALYYAIFIMIVLSSIGFMLINFFELKFREDTLFYKSAELDDHLNSALHLVACQPDLVPVGASTSLDIFDDNSAIVSASCERWGLFRKLSFMSSWRTLKKEMVFIMAEKEKERPALWMPDKKKYVSLVGKSSVSGDCYMSELGLRKGNAEGRYFEGPFLHHGRLLKSGEVLPLLNEEFLRYIHNYFNGESTDRDSVASLQTIKQGEPLFQSFGQKTIVFRSNSKVILDNGMFNDNIIIQSSDTIEVWPGTVLNSIQLYARVIVFKEGFTGSLQAFANERLVVETGCQFKYPSMLSVLNFNGPSAMQFGAGSKLNGGIVVYTNSTKEGDASLSVAENCKLNGKVVVFGDVTLKSSITGSLYCDRFVHVTPRAFYENFMIDVDIDETKLPDEYASYCVGNELYKLKQLQQCQL